MRFLAFIIGILLWGEATMASEATRLIERSQAAQEAYRDAHRKTQTLDKGLLDDAIRTARSAMDIAREAGAQEVVARAALSLGSGLRMAGDWDGALEALSVASDGPADVAAEAFMQRARALMYRPDPDFGAARQALTAARGLLTPGDQEMAYRHLSHMAELEGYLGETRASVALARESLALADEVSDPTAHFYAHFTEADAFQVEATKCDYIDTFDLCRAAADAAGRAYQRARLHALMNGWHGLANQMMQMQSNTVLRRKLIDQKEGFYSNLGGVFAPASAGDVLVNDTFLPGEAPTDAALAALVGLASDGASARALYLRAKDAELTGDKPTARALLHEAMDRLEEERGSISDPRRSGAVTETRSEFYRDAFLFDLDAGDHSRAFETLERSRGRGLAEFLANRPSPDTRVSLAAIVEADIALAQSQAALFACILTEPAPPDALPVEGPSSLRSGQCDEQAARAARARADRGAVSAAAAVSTGDWTPPTLEQVTDFVEARDLVLLQYFATDTNLIVWPISAKTRGQEADAVRAVFLPRTVLEEKVAALRTSMEAQEDGMPTQAFEQALAEELYFFLIAPFERWFGDSDRIVVIPQGELGHLPFEALFDPQKGTFLNERYAVGYVPNATFLLQPVSKDRPNHGVSVTDSTLGDVVKQSYAAAKRALPDFAFSELADKSREGLRAAAETADIVHFTIHGSHDPAEPLLSKLEIPAGDGWDDEPWYLRAVDMLALPLDHARLAVIASCEAAISPSTIANESYGMPWALKIAGAEEVVLARWQVNDAVTTRLLSDFYAALPSADARGGLDTIGAMRAAKSARIVDPETRHPYYWAGFQTFAR